MDKKEQVPALAMFVQGSLWVWPATSQGRPPDGGLALAVFHKDRKVGEPVPFYPSHSREVSVFIYLFI